MLYNVASSPNLASSHNSVLMFRTTVYWWYIVILKKISKKLFIVYVQYNVRIKTSHHVEAQQPVEVDALQAGSLTSQALAEQALPPSTHVAAL